MTPEEKLTVELFKKGPTRTWCKHSGPDGTEGRCHQCAVDDAKIKLEVLGVDVQNRVVTFKTVKK